MDEEKKPCDLSKINDEAQKENDEAQKEEEKGKIQGFPTRMRASELSRNQDIIFAQKDLSYGVISIVDDKLDQLNPSRPD